MKDIINGILEEYANNEANLHSEALREQLTEDIVKALKHDPRDISSDEWRISQYNRNRTMKDQISSIEELDEKIRKMEEPEGTPYTKEEVEKWKKTLSEEIVEEESIEFKKYIYESPDGGKTVYRREFGDYDTPREKINWEEEKERMKDTWDDPFKAASNG
tara:strand:+ start:309 stop:791 length:483 start_codon:yes stop_codon:yes gene_type:complete